MGRGFRFRRSGNRDDGVDGLRHGRPPDAERAAGGQLLLILFPLLLVLLLLLLCYFYYYYCCYYYYDYYNCYYYYSGGGVGVYRLPHLRGGGDADAGAGAQARATVTSDLNRINHVLANKVLFICCVFCSSTCYHYHHIYFPIYFYSALHFCAQGLLPGPRNVGVDAAARAGVRGTSLNP